MAKFIAAIEAADNVVRDSIVRSQQATETETVKNAMDKANMKLKEVKFFVQKTFDKSAGTQYAFGLQDFGKVRYSSSKMVPFLEVLYATCLEYAPELNAKGFGAAAIAEIDTIKTELEQSGQSQSGAKKERLVQTENRIKILNACYAMMAQVNKAAQLVFRNDYAKQNQYVYYVGKRKRKGKVVSLVSEV
ncbi:MAG: hypothetical protein U0U67_12835 [Chitinophagales bacterium]